jgi:hypothetical protein
LTNSFGEVGRGRTTSETVMNKEGSIRGLGWGKAMRRLQVTRLLRWVQRARRGPNGV